MEEPRSDLAMETVETPSEPAAENENFTTLDYVRELYLNSEEQKKLEKKKIRLIRAGLTVLAVMAAAVIVSGALVVPALLTTANEATKTLAEVQKVDMVGIAANVDALALQASDTFVQVGDAVAVLDELDMDTLNETIGELKTAVDNFSTLDVDTLNTAIANLNATVTPLAKLFGKN